jgi:plastocyanin
LKHERGAGLVKKGLSPAVSFLAIFLLISSCASRQPVLTIDHTDEQLTLVIKASNFEFVPGHIRVPRGKEILLNIENISGTGHNFTIKDPGGKVLQSVALPPNKRVSVELRLGEPGLYPFYCDKPFHSTLGMNGTIEVMSDV